MTEQKISYETAILAHEKGFRYPVINNCPQSVLQKWLRDEHFCFVNVFLSGGKKHSEPFYPYDSFSHKEPVFISCIQYKGEQYWVEENAFDVMEYSTWEEALEAGLLESLSLL